MKHVRPLALSASFGAALSLGAALVATLGCAPPPPQPPHEMVPVAEGRARQILATVFEQKGLRPMRGATMALEAGGTIDVDIGAVGRKFGVCYLTKPEIQAALPYIGAMPVDSGALKVVRGGGADADATLLILAATNYVADDQLGAERDDTTITAESKIARDARDFLAKAQEGRWP